MNKRVAILVFILSLVLSIAFFYFRDFFKGAESLGLLGIFLINFVSNASFFVSGPAFLTVIAGGALYPPILVAIASSLGSAAGDVISFIVGFTGRHIINHKLNQKIWFRVLEDYFKKFGGIILFIFALIPNPFFDSIGLIAGIFHYNIWKYLLIVFVGRLIRFFLLATLGSHF